jgi:hypothetical protein
VRACGGRRRLFEARDEEGAGGDAEFFGDVAKRLAGEGDVDGGAEGGEVSGVDGEGVGLMERRMKDEGGRMRRKLVGREGDAGFVAQSRVVGAKGKTPGSGWGF